LAARSSKQQDFVFAASRKLFRALASVDRGGERVFQSYEHLVRSDGERVYVQCELEEGFSDLLHPPSAVLFSNAVASKDVQSLDGLLNGLNDVAVVFWYVGYRPVQDYFKEAVRVREEDDEFVISCSGKFGEAEFRVSESTGYLPRMFEITLRRDVTVGEITVGEMLGSFPSSDGLTIAGTASRFHATPDGTIIPSAIHVQRSVSQDDQSREFLLATTIEIKSIEFNPSIGDDEFRPRLPLPANTLVGARDASHLDFIWDGKWVVPKVQPVSYLEVQGRGWSFQILLAFNVLTIAAALIIIILGRQKKHAGRTPGD